MVQRRIARHGTGPWRLLTDSLPAVIVGLSMLVAVMVVGRPALAKPVSVAQLSAPAEAAATGSPAAPQAPSAPEAGAAKVSSTCPACPTAAVDTLARRVDVLTKAVETAMSSPKPEPIDPWQDAKSLLLNVLGNRIDAFIFGDGQGNVGAAAQLVAVFAFGIALLRFALALAMVRAGAPTTSWGRLKARLRNSPGVRIVGAGLAFLAVLYTGAALYVVLSARATPDVAQASISMLQESLQTCQAGLSAAIAQDKPAVQPAPAAAPALTLEALDRVGRTCEAAIQATDARVAALQAKADAIEGKQPWALTKFLAFLVAVYLVIAVSRIWWLKEVRG